MEAFYSLKPAQTNMYKDFDKLPQEFSMKYDGLAQQEIQRIVDGKATISEALDSLQAQGQKLLTDESNKKKEQSSAEPSTSTIEQSNSGVASAANSTK